MTSLHTKYRPISFDEVIGQKPIIASLKRVVQDKRAKCFLFTGPSGTGKTTLARILANAFAEGQATAANIDEIDAASKSGVDDIRLVVSHAYYRAVGASPIKAILVDECHKLSASAWNALLKPTEEPPKHVYWFLCSTEPGKIPKTILTRFLRYELKAVSEELIFKLLCTVADKEQLDASDEVLEAIAEGAGGSPRQALVYLEACAYAETASEARQIMRSTGQSKEVIDLCRWLIKGEARNWVQACKYVKAMEGQEAEGIRIVVLAYLTKALLDVKEANSARKLLFLVSCFERPYNQTDRLAPLLVSLGLVLGLDR